MNLQDVTRGGSDHPPLYATAPTAQQQRLWFLDEMDPGTPTYNIAYAARFRGPLDAGALQRAFRLVVSRHDALRTVFPEVDGSPEQHVLPFVDVPLAVADLGAMPSGEREREAERLIREEGAHPFDLARGPLLRTRLVRLSPEDHVLLVTVHHIVFDGWSESILMRELGAAYGGYSQGREPDLGDAPPSYAEIAHRQEALLTPDLFQGSLAYWKERLAGAPPLLTLPTDHPRPSRQSYRGALVPFQIDFPLLQSLKALARAERVSVFMILAAALGTVLARRSGQDDVSIGFPVAGRTMPESDGVIGLFVNTIVLRSDLSGNPTFQELLARVRDSALSAYEHQELPLEKLVEELSPERTLAHAPLFQVMLALQNIQGLGFALPGLVRETLRPDPGTSRFDLTFFINEGPLGFSGALEYATDLFEKPTAERFVREFLGVLAKATLRPDGRIQEIPLVGAEERRRIVAEWNQTDAPLPETTIPALVAARLAAAGGGAAVSCGGATISGRELQERSDRLARLLRSLGAGPDVPVGLSVERSAEMVVGLLGILKSGSAYLPLDPAYPTERLTYMLADSGAPLLVTEASLVPRFSGSAVRPVLLAEDGDAPGVELVPPSPEDLAYVIYTSGSTGRPKGVEVPHRALSNLIAHFARTLETSTSDVLVSVTTLSFDIAGLEIWLPLATGAQLVVAERREAADGAALVELLARSGATLFQATPTTYRLLLEAGWKGSKALTLLCGGEMVPRDLAEELLRRARALFDVYGPTETTIWSAMDRVASGGGSVPVGRPIANTQIYVLDARGEPAPIGVPGELFIGGAGVARGYHARPDLTAERFVPDTISGRPGERLYRTGDLAKFLEDGRVEVLGRLDQQVKLRGFRIELGEIEAALATHPGVAQGAVAVKGEGAERRLVAYIVSGGKAVPRPAELREHLARLLPDYMLPAAFVSLAALPLTPNRKVDRSALPEPEAVVETRPALVSSDPTEGRLVAIFREVLGKPGIGAEDDFFEAGGHSLLAVRLFTRVEKVFGKKLPLATVFTAPTPAALAAILRGGAAAATKASWSPIVPIQTKGTKTPLFCFHAVGGNVLTYFDLSRHLGEGQPVYGVQAKGLDGKEEPHASVEEMARCYAEEIRKMLPEGPYHLCGSSFGGLVAYEVARQLRAAGADVGVLALFDTWGPDYPRRVLGISAGKLRWERLRERVDLHLGNFRVAEGLSGKWDYLRTKTTRLARELGKRARRFRKRVRERIHPLPQELRKVEAKSRWAMESYLPGEYVGPITLFRASRQPAGFVPDPELGWTRVARGCLEVHEVPGYHGAIVYEPRVGGLARELARTLAAFEAGGGAAKAAPAQESLAS